MRLSAPTQVVWWIAVIAGVLGLLGHLGVVAALAGFAFWLVFIGFALLVVATMVKGL
jgi:hypothetical protein